MPQSLRAVIFDLDGVLADSKPCGKEIDLSEVAKLARGLMDESEL